MVGDLHTCRNSGDSEPWTSRNSLGAPPMAASSCSAIMAEAPVSSCRKFSPLASFHSPLSKNDDALDESMTDLGGLLALPEVDVMQQLASSSLLCVQDNVRVTWQQDHNFQSDEKVHGQHGLAFR